MSLKTAPIIFFFFSFSFSLFVISISAANRHVINFRSPNLYPESLSWDPSAQHFVVGSLRHPSLFSISDAAVVDTLLSDPSLPPNSTILGVIVDKHKRRLLAVVHSPPPHPVFNALAAYDLRSPLRPRLFLAPLDDPAATSSDRPIANDVAFDFSGNAYVTNSAGNLIWKVTPSGEPSVFSRSPAFDSHPVETDKLYSFCGLNGVVYVSKGYLLVVQSNTGKMFKVDAEDGTARTVLLNRDLTAADGIAVRRDGVVVVVSHEKAYFIKSDSSWSEGVVFDETALEAERFASSVAVGGGDRVYVLYGHVDEGMMGNGEREEFSIVEVESEKESKEESVWIYVMIGLGLAYFALGFLRAGPILYASSRSGPALVQVIPHKPILCELPKLPPRSQRPRSRSAFFVSCSSFKLHPRSRSAFFYFFFSTQNPKSLAYFLFSSLPKALRNPEALKSLPESGILPKFVCAFHSLNR